MDQTTIKNLDSSSHSLSIQISSNGFSFCIYDENFKLIKLKQFFFEGPLTPESLLKKVENVYKKNIDLSATYAKVDVVYQNELFSLVPEKLFDPDHLNLYLKYSVKTLVTDFMAYDDLEKEHIKVVYVPYVNINNFFFEKYGSFSYYHSQTILIRTILFNNDYKNGDQIICNILPSQFELLALKNGEIVLANTFLYENENDFLYYLLFTVEQLVFNPETFYLTFFGIESNDDPLLKLTIKYIRHVHNNRPDIPNFDHPVETKGLFTLLNTNTHANYFRNA